MLGDSNSAFWTKTCFWPVNVLLLAVKMLMLALYLAKVSSTGRWEMVLGNQNLILAGGFCAEVDHCGLGQLPGILAYQSL